MLYGSHTHIFQMFQHLQIRISDAYAELLSVWDLDADPVKFGFPIIFNRIGLNCLFGLFFGCFWGKVAGTSEADRGIGPAS